MSSIPKLIQVNDVAHLLGVSEQRVRTLLREGHLAGEQVGGQWLTDVEAVHKYRLRAGKFPTLDQKNNSKRLPAFKALSFFSGAMGLDIGLEQAGIKPILACEFDNASRQTILANRPNIGLIGDIWNYSAEDIRQMAGLNEEDEIDLIVGGPPCQAFSTAGARRGFLDSRGNALLRYLELILELNPKFAVIENVRGLLSAPIQHTPHNKRGEDWIASKSEKPGGALLYIIEKLRQGGYGVSFNLYNAANFGVPQSRERVVIVCSRDGSELPYLKPTHSESGDFGLPKWKTLREAFEGIDEENIEHMDFPVHRLKYFRLLGPGQYWKDLPEDIQEEAMGKSFNSGGGKTGFYRRLHWTKPSCTLVTSPIMPATAIGHPKEDRPLSVQEYKRIQEFPDDWSIMGSMAEKYKQIGNAVPVGLGRAIGKLILSYSKGKTTVPPEGFPFSRYKGTDHITWEQQTLASQENQKKGSVKVAKNQLLLLETKQI